MVALNWRGNQHKESPLSAGVRGRSFPLSDFEALDSLKRCTVLSVQVGEACQELSNSWLRHYLNPLQSILDQPGRDFLSTADALLQTDLLLTNDTSVAHLGGLLNVPTWVILKCHPYWQWGDQGSSSVWYSSVLAFDNISQETGRKL